MRATRVAGIVFANMHDELLNKLTAKRSMASVPFGARYRLIDFPLSNLVGAGISNVGLITKENYRSLLDHVGSGVYWDLDRKTGGLHLMPPYSVRGAKRYSGYVEALYGAIDFVARSNAEYIVVHDAGVVANIDIASAVSAHVQNSADITVVYHNGKKPQYDSDSMILSLDAEQRVTGIVFSDDVEVDVNYSLGVMILRSELLIELVERAYNSEYTSINRDILAKLVSKLRIFGYRHEGCAFVMDSETAFFEANMRLLEADVRRDLFNPERPVFTKTRDDMPTRYGTHADVRNCYIADGCVINGTVRNSILFRGVTVERGAVIENSILMQGVHVLAGAQLDRVISDKNAVIGREMVLKGNGEESFLVKKNQTV